MEDAHIKTVDEVIKYFGADPERGLTIDQVNKNQEKYGPNGELSYYTVLNTLKTSKHKPSLNYSITK